MSCILSSVPATCDLQLSHRHFGDCPGDPMSFDFSFLAIFASRLSSILFTRLLIHLVSILDPVDVADVFVFHSAERCRFSSPLFL